MEKNTSPKIIKLEIDDEDLDSGVNCISLVQSPAIEEDFYLFSKQEMESYTDYPQAASDNAQMALNWVEKNGWGSCGTPVGKRRANQLANREPISEDTISRMAAFERHRRNSKTPYGEGCGKLMWDAWGGDEGIAWAKRKLEQIKREKELAIEVGNLPNYINEVSQSFVENAGGFSVGDYVSWTYAGRGEGDDRGRGQIKELRVSGKLKVPETDFELSPTEDRPAALIETRDGTLVGQYTENLRKIKKPEDFADIPVFDNAEEAIIYSMIIGCEGEIHTHKLDDGTTIYMPCATMEDAQSVIDVIEELKTKPNYWSDLSDDLKEDIYNYLMQVGEDEAELRKQGWVRDDSKEFANVISQTGLDQLSKPDDPSFEDVGKSTIYRYKYQVKAGKGRPIEPNSREFCKRLINANKLYRKEDINQMTIMNANPGFAKKGALVYDIFLYTGGLNCRHEWVKQAFKRAEVKDLPPSWKTKDKTNTIFPLLGFAEQKEKQIVAGPLMIPEQLIYRYDDFNGEYWVYFGKDTIERIAHKYMKEKNQDQSNLEHSEYLKLEDVSLVETWIVDDPDKDKSYALTGKKYPKGTWWGLMQIKDKGIWDEWVKTGKVSGFSVEGFFIDQIINASTQNFYYRTTKGGTDIVIDHKTMVVFILEDGERVAILPDGTYELTNGETLVVRESKAVSSSFTS